MSKELEALEELNYNLGLTKTTTYINHYYDIKNALIKAQIKSDKEIAFDLIDTKNVDIKLLKWAYPSVEAYNTKVRTEKDYWWRDELTKEEFEFLGRMVGAE